MTDLEKMTDLENRIKLVERDCFEILDELESIKAKLEDIPTDGIIDVTTEVTKKFRNIDIVKGYAMKMQFLDSVEDLAEVLDEFAEFYREYCAGVSTEKCSESRDCYKCIEEWLRAEIKE